MADTIGEAMKYLLRVFLFHCFSLWLVSQVFPALILKGGLSVLATAGGILSLLMLLVRPILKILFIPINIITFGLLSWCIDAIVLFLLTIAVPEVIIRAWTFPGITWAGFVLPSMHLSYAVALVLVSLSVSAMVNMLHDIADR